MKNRFLQLWKSEKKAHGSQDNQALDHSCAGRILSTLTFIIVIVCLGLWIIAFLLLKDYLFMDTLSGNILTNLTCLTFFGGLVIAILVGELAGNYLRRTFWKILSRRRKL
jgi:hypothetical protein